MNEVQEDDLAAALSDLRTTCESLKSLGITQVSIEYNGSNDEGMIDDVIYTPSDVEIPPALNDELERCVYELLPGGWEIDEGGYGELVIDCVDETVKHEHSQWFLSSDTDSSTYDLTEVAV